MRVWDERGRKASLVMRVKVALRGWVDWARPMLARAAPSTVVETTCSAITKVPGSIMFEVDPGKRWRSWLVIFGGVVFWFPFSSVSLILTLHISTSPL